MLQGAEVHLVSHHGDVEQSGRKQFPWQNTGLMQMQSAGKRENDRGTGIDTDGFVALAVKVSEPARVRFENILDAAGMVLVGGRGGVVQVEHHAGSAGVEHFHYKVAVIGSTR